MKKQPEKLEDIYGFMRRVMEGVLDKSISPEEGDVVAKAGHVACKLIEVDLHSRVFAHKIATALPPE